MTQSKQALVAGATGLIGRELVQLLLDSPAYEKVTVLVRRPLSLGHPKLEQVVVDFDRLRDFQAAFAGVQDVFCCLGTTIKKAKSKEAFEKVDYAYPVELAKLAKEHGADKYLIVTAMGSDAQSSLFYNKVKGRVEQTLEKMSLPALLIFRPSLLLGDRDEFRFGEHTAALITQALPFLFAGPLRKYKPIQGRTVAAAMREAAQQSVSGMRVLASNEIAELGRKVIQ